jgi:hypothetical protein
MPVITVQIGFTGTRTTPVWTDVSKYFVSGQMMYGRQRETDHFAAGTGSVKFTNVDGRFSPDNLSGPYVTGGTTTQVVPWVPIWIQATWSAVTYNVFFGYISVWTEDYVDGYQNYVTASIVDPMATLGTHFGSNPGSSVGGGESTGARISRLLTDAGNVLAHYIDGVDTFTVTGVLNPSTCFATVQSTNLSSNTLQEILTCADSEGGAFWWDPILGTSGGFVFERYAAQVENSRSNTSQVTFGDGGGAEIAYEMPTTPISDGLLLWNDAQFQRSGGTTVQSSDSTSITVYGDRRYSSPTLFCEQDIFVQSLANFFVARFKAPEARVPEVTIHPAANNAAWPHALGRRIRDRVTLKRRPPSSTAYTISRNCFIDGVAHQFTNQDWRTTFKLSSASAWDGFTTGTWGSAVWGTTKWFY